MVDEACEVSPDGMMGRCFISRGQMPALLELKRVLSSADSFLCLC